MGLDLKKTLIKSLVLQLAGSFDHSGYGGGGGGGHLYDRDKT